MGATTGIEDAWSGGTQVAQAPAGSPGGDLPSAPFDRFAPAPFDQPATSSPRGTGPDGVQDPERISGNAGAREAVRANRELRERMRNSAAAAAGSGYESAAAEATPAEPVRSKTIEARLVARQMLEEARQLAELGHVVRARQLAHQASRFPVTWDEQEESPQQLLARLDGAAAPDNDAVPVATFGSAQSKIIYPAWSGEGAEALRRLPDTQSGETGQEAADESGLATENPPADEIGGGRRIRSKILEVGPPVPFRKPNWDTVPPRTLEPGAETDLGPGAPAPASVPAPPANVPSPPVGAQFEPASLQLVPPHDRPANRLDARLGGGPGNWGPPLDAYRQHAYTATSGSKVIDGRPALEATAGERAGELDRLEFERWRESQRLAMPAAQPGIEAASYQQLRPLVAATPPQLLRIEAGGSQTAASSETAIWLHQLPLLAFFLGLLLCPLTLAFCFAVAVRQIARHQGPLLQVQFSGGPDPVAGRFRRRRTAQDRDELDEDDDSGDEREGRHRAAHRRQRPKRRGPTRRTAVLDPTSPEAAHRLPPLPGMGDLAAQRAREEEEQRARDEAILRHVWEENMKLREQLRAADE
ncbi:MAG: hypothetical protein J5I93_27330 [Pirellulaceae bacterium]|nr:hypothetical protein [Pirellulaceae bacterium]